MTRTKKILLGSLAGTLIFAVGISAGIGVAIGALGMGQTRVAVLNITEGFRIHQRIAHAMGGIDGRIHTNSLEAFNLAYQNGFRVFEIDLRLIGENQTDLVAMHSIGTYNRFVNANFTHESQVTLDKFLNTKIYGQYTPLAWRDVVQLMYDNPEIYIVVDGKYSTYELVVLQYQILVTEVQEKYNYAQILSRIVPYIYHESMFYWINKVYQFPEYIFAHYIYHPSFNRIVNFIAMTPQITAVAISFRRLDSPGFANRLANHGVVLYVHTIFSESNFQRMQRRGAYGMITPLLSPN
ncbi:MAG: hypothetical protein FWE01_02490 [Firmicutes bacterium]|nr:hypothetical protein [Bacillota bacterium]